MHTSRPLFARVGLLTLAVAYLALFLGGTWHLSLEGHARCAEHGEWIDVAHAPVPVHPPHHAGPVLRSAGSPEAHEHCVIVEASRLRAVVCDDAPTELAPTAPAAILEQPAAGPLSVGFERYLLAPKQSPPC